MEVDNNMYDGAKQQGFNKALDFLKSRGIPVRVRIRFLLQRASL